MATVYWYGGSGNWSDYANHWSNNSGNSPASNHGAAPGTDDDVVFDSASHSTSYTVTIDGTCNCNNITFSNPASGSPTMDGNQTLNVYGSLTLVSGMTFSMSGNLYFKSTATGKTINTAGVTIRASTVFDGSGGGWTLQSNLTVTNSIVQNYGEIDAATYNVTSKSFASNNSNTRSIKLGTGTWEVNNTGAVVVWNMNTITNLSLDPGDSTIKINVTDSNKKTLRFGGTTYKNLWITGTGSGTSALDQQKNNTFNEIKIDAGKTVTFFNASNTTVNKFTAPGTSGSHITISNSSSTTTATLTKAGGGTISGCDYVDATYLVGSPDETWYIGANSTVTNCTNIYASSPPSTSTGNFFAIL